MADKKSGSKWDSSGSEDEGIKKTIESVVAIKKRKLISEDATFDKSSTNLNNLTPGESIDNTSTTVSPKPPSNEQTDLVSKSNVVLTSPLLQLKTDTDDTSAILKKQVGTATSSSSLFELSNDVDEVMINRNPLFYGCRSVDEYVRLNFIDQGTYGVVFRARCKKSNKIYALKQVKIGRESSKVGFPITALRETNILLALRHKNIVYVREMVVGTTIDKVLLIIMIQICIRCIICEV